MMMDSMTKKPKSKMSRRLGKVRKVMHEFKAGTLKSSSGGKVTDHKQAIAIALSEAGMSRHGTSDGEERGAMGPKRKAAKSSRQMERDF